MPSRLLEPSPYEVDRGNLIGRDPRKLTGDDFIAEGVELSVPRHAIRKFCLQCCEFSESEVRKCVSVHCPLWAMRMSGGLTRTLRNSIKEEVLDKDDE